MQYYIKSKNYHQDLSLSIDEQKKKKKDIKYIHRMRMMTRARQKTILKI